MYKRQAICITHFFCDTFVQFLNLFIVIVKQFHKACLCTGRTFTCLLYTSQPVVWRGPIVGNAVRQFWTDVVWEELDYLLIDMPPGTGDVALTVLQNMPVNGIVMVSRCV